MRRDAWDRARGARAHANGTLMRGGVSFFWDSEVSQTPTLILKRNDPLHSAGAATREQPELRAKGRYADPLSGWDPGGWVGMQVKIS